MARRYWIETLGCPKNKVDSDKLVGTLEADGLVPAGAPQAADLVVVNTCAFIEAARQESIDTILDLSDGRRLGARLVVTGCMAERYGDELAAALPEVDLVAGFGVPVTLTAKSAKSATGSGGADPADQPETQPPPQLQPHPGPRPVPSLDLLNLPRPRAEAPWAYVKVAEGCDRACGFCAIPSFRGKQRSRSLDAILTEVDDLAVQEVVLVAQDLASYGRDEGRYGDIVPLVRAVAARVPRTRLLYLYPSELTDSLIDVMGETSCPYFDLSLQHASKRHLRRMRRWGDRSRFLARIATIRARYPDAALRSSFIVGYPGETEDDHDELLGFLAEAALDWAGFFAFSREDGTYAAGLPDTVPEVLIADRLLECSQLQDAITARRRQALVGTTVEVLVDEPDVGRSHREAPEIDGIVRLAPTSPASPAARRPRPAAPRRAPAAATGPARASLVGQFVKVAVTGAAGPDLEAELV